MVSDFSSLKEELASLTVELETLLGRDDFFLPLRGAVAAVQARLAAEDFRIVVVGEFSKGRSTFLNALLRGPYLPVGLRPTTHVLYELRHGSKISGRIVFLDGAEQSIDGCDLKTALTPFADSQKAAAVEKIVITLPSTILENGVILLDTPSIGRLNECPGGAAYQALADADAER